MPVDTAGLRGPYRRSDGVNVDQVLTPTGWLGRTVGTMSPRHPRRVRAAARAADLPPSPRRIGDGRRGPRLGFCGDIVTITAEAVTLRDRQGQHRQFRYKPGGFLIDGKPVTLVRAGPRSQRRPAGDQQRLGRRPPAGAAQRRHGQPDLGRGQATTPSWSSTCGATTCASWGSSSSRCTASTTWSAWSAEFAPSPAAPARGAGRPPRRRLEGGAPRRQVRGPDVLVTGHPFVDVWAGVRPQVIGLDAWPDVPRGVEWKEGMCDALGVSLTDFWPHLRNRCSDVCGSAAGTGGGGGAADRLRGTARRWRRRRLIGISTAAIATSTRNGAVYPMKIRSPRAP